MPSYSIVVEDNSPYVVYSNFWRAGTSRDDNSADLYSQSSFSVTNVQNANMTFTFHGTRVQIFGAKRDNHGNYQVYLDGHVILEANGGGSNTFQVSLFDSGSLTLDQHTVELVNLENKYLDVDYITFQTSMGLDNETLVTKTLQDSDSSFTYSPTSAWSDAPTNLGLYMGHSGHFASSDGASVEFDFEGNSILVASIKAGDQRFYQGNSVEVYGPVSPNGASYSVQLDDGIPTNYTSIQQFYRPQTLLYYAGGLQSGAHKLKFNSQLLSNQTFAIDYANVYTTSSLATQSSLIQSSAPLNKQLSPGAIAGITLGTLAGLLVLIAFFYLLVVKIKKKRASRDVGLPFIVDRFPSELNMSSIQTYPVHSGSTISASTLQRQPLESLEVHKPSARPRTTDVDRVLSPGRLPPPEYRVNPPGS